MWAFVMVLACSRHMKAGLGNLSAATLDQLIAAIRSCLGGIQRQPALNRRIPRPDRTHHRIPAPVAARP